MKDGFVQTAKHGEIHYLEAGSGAPLILLHSNGGSAYEWEHCIDELGAKYHVYAWDMPGHGDSDPLTRHKSVEGYAEAVVEMMEALGLKKASVAGCSIGGGICVQLGAHHAERIDHLFIVESPFRTPEEWLKMWPATELNYSVATQPFEKVAPRLNTVMPDVLTRWNIDRNKAGTKAMLDVMWALRRYDIAANVKKVSTDTTLIFGRKGPTVAKVSKYQEALPNARLVILENSGHFPMIDDPHGLIEAIDQSMKRAK
jgi:pimeloyl-ACP methyl ester carboxylesterase